MLSLPTVPSSGFCSVISIPSSLSAPLPTFVVTHLAITPLLINLSLDAFVVRKGIEPLREETVFAL